MGERRSKIDLVPDAAIPDVQEAWDAILGRRSTAEAIRAVLNEALQTKGLETISAGGFNRWAMAVRDGNARRPGSQQDPTDKLVVFDPKFRDRLIFAIGAVALSQLELTMVALEAYRRGGDA